MKHDHPDRQAESFFRLLCQLIAWLCIEAHGPNWEFFPESLRLFLTQGSSAEPSSSTDVGLAARKLLSELKKSKAEFCLRLTPKYIAEMLAQLGCAMTALLHLEVLHQTASSNDDLRPRDAAYPFQEIIRTALEETKFSHLLAEFTFDPQRDAFMLDIVGNTVCADLLDYACRDSHYSGLRLDYDSDRIAENFSLVSVDATAYEINHRHPLSADGARRSAEAHRNPFDGWCLRAAISLVSHKYRTDISSELMNLLNVRFYLYERVIFHPTKCAAGSMLGTALQLLGWRKHPSGINPTLPPHLRFVGDDVFLHDIASSLDCVIGSLGIQPPEALINEELLKTLDQLDQVHSGLAPAIARLRIGQKADAVVLELRAARFLLNRLMSRRYFRPVFRALPSTKDTTLQAGAEALADLFRQPDLRYRVERQIESKAGLPLGTVTIHCPTRNTAKKIANVFLTKPDDQGDDLVCKLKDIGSLDQEIFGDHEKAVHAVEQMYGSMWRLSVYVAPEHMEQWEHIGRIAGRVIFEEVDTHHHFLDRPNRQWENDKNLILELSGKLGASIGDTGGEPDSESLGDALNQIGEDLVTTGRLRTISPGLFSPEEGFAPEAKRRVEEALITALSEPVIEPVVHRDRSAPRTEQVLTVIRTYVKRIKREEIEIYRKAYAGRLNELRDEAFEIVMKDLDAAANESIALDRQPTEHKGAKFKESLELLDQLLNAYGPKDSEKVSGLFGEVEG